MYFYFRRDGVRWRTPEPSAHNFQAVYKHFLKCTDPPPPELAMCAPDGENYFKAMFRAARARANRNSRPFTLPDNWMFEQYRRQDCRCAISGLTMLKTQAKHDPWAPSIDRIDPEQGYTPENCQLVCYAVNTAKNQFSMEVLLTVCQAIANKARGTEQEQNGTLQTNPEVCSVTTGGCE